MLLVQPLTVSNRKAGNTFHSVNIFSFRWKYNFKVYLPKNIYWRQPTFCLMVSFYSSHSVRLSLPLYHHDGWWNQLNEVPHLRNWNYVQNKSPFHRSSNLTWCDAPMNRSKIKFLETASFVAGLDIHVDNLNMKERPSHAFTICKNSVNSFWPSDAIRMAT